MTFFTSIFGEDKVTTRCWACKKEFKAPIGENTCPSCLKKIKEGAEF